MQRNRVGWICLIIVLATASAVNHITLTRAVTALEATAAALRLEKTDLEVELCAAAYSIERGNKMLALAYPGADRPFLEPVFRE
jgi:hypothetical protein